MAHSSHLRFCPICNGAVELREARPMGDSICVNRHHFPRDDELTKKRAAPMTDATASTTWAKRPALVSALQIARQAYVEHAPTCTGVIDRLDKLIIAIGHGDAIRTYDAG